MFEVPIHPILVHIPVALSVLMPLLFGGLILAIRRDLLPARSWWIAVLFQLVLTIGCIASLGSGHAEEERVEDFVPHEAIESHERLAGAMTAAAVIALVIAAAGLRQSPKEGLFRTGALLTSLFVLGLAGAAGHRGGELVYKHGAAGNTPAIQSSSPASPEEEEESDRR